MNRHAKRCGSVVEPSRSLTESDLDDTGLLCKKDEPTLKEGLHALPPQGSERQM